MTITSRKQTFQDAAQTLRRKKRQVRKRRLPDEMESDPEQSGAIAGPREVIEQAVSDIRAGLIDTDRRRQPDDVPGPHIDPEHTPGAQVPPGRVGRNKGTVR